MVLGDEYDFPMPLEPTTPKIYLSPDGENCLDKTLDATRIATKFGAMFAGYDMILISQPTKLGAIASRFLYFTVPAACMGLAFASTGCMMGMFRGKDDLYNHGVAGAAAASVIGARYGMKVGINGAILLGGAAALTKFLMGAENGVFIPKPENRKKIFFQTTPRYGDKLYEPREIKPPSNY